MTVDEYFDATAAFYDAQYDDPGDVEFYLDLAREADGPVLEVGCGTGRIYLELLREGVDVDGIDVSSEMLSVLREKATRDALEPSVRQADVRTFDPEPGREYALVIVPFRAFLHLLTVEDQLAALERIHDALEAGGRLALNAFVPNTTVICEQYGEWDEGRVSLEGRTYAIRSRSTLVDEVKRRVRLETEIHDAGDGGGIEDDDDDDDGDAGELLRRSEAAITLLSRREFELLFRCSPFASWEVYGDFEYDPLESAEQEQVWLATATR